MCLVAFASLVLLVISVVESCNNHCRGIPSYCNCEIQRSNTLALSCTITNLNELNILSDTNYNHHVSTLTVRLIGIEDLPSSIFRFRELTTLNIEGDDLSSINNDTFYGLRLTLRDLNVRDTKLQEVPTAAILALSNLKSLSLERNVIVALSESLQNTGLKHIIVRDNKIEEIKYAILPPSLQSLDLSLNDLRSLNAALRGNLTELVTVNISYNNVDRIAGELEDTPNLKNLYANRNAIVSIDNGDLARVPQVKILDLSNNCIHEIVDGLNGLTDLKELYLSYNDLTNLHAMAFSDLTALETLYLDHNNISDIQDSLFDCLNSLRILDISYNKFVTVNFLDTPSDSSSLGTEGTNCNFRDYAALQQVNIEGNGVTCETTVQNTLQILESKDIQIIGGPCAS